jgi:hypothetical protein
MINRNIVVCLECAKILESKHRHDYKECGCPQATMVDGGTDYIKCGGKDLSKLKNFDSMAEAKEFAKTIKK